MNIEIRDFKRHLRSLLDDSNPKGDYDISRKLISVLKGEILRLYKESRGVKNDQDDGYMDGQDNTNANTTSHESARRYECSFTSDATSQEDSSFIPIDEIEMVDNGPTPVGISPSAHEVISSDTSLTSDFANVNEQELRDVANIMHGARKIIVFMGAGISTNCGIPDFRSEAGLHKTNKGLFEKGALDDEERRKELYSCLIKIRNISNSEDLVQTDTHRLLQALQRSGKLQRCYTQNFDGLELKAGLSADMESENCEVVQLHGTLNDLWCPVCNHMPAWTGAYEAALASGEKVKCPNCASRLDERMRIGKRATQKIGCLRPNIVLFGDDPHPFDELKASIIDRDADTNTDVLLIIGTSLAVYGPKMELKRKLIPATRRNGGKVIYINDRPPPADFRKPLVDHILEMDCDLWARDIAAREPSSWNDNSKQTHGRLRIGFDFQPKAKTVDDVIQEAELNLINVGDYSDIPFRFTETNEKEEVKRQLESFRPGNWLLSQPVQCILSLFRWSESTRVLGTMCVNLGYKNTSQRKAQLKESVWPVDRKHERVIIPHSSNNIHWILIEIRVPNREIYVYNSLPGYDLRAVEIHVREQMELVGEQLGLDYSTWNSLIDGNSHRQTNGSDCGIYLLENARRLSQNEAVNGEPVEADSLRVLYAELLLARSLYEASERSMLKNVLYPEYSRLWQVGAAPRSFSFTPGAKPTKRRRLLLQEIEAQSASIDENCSESEGVDTRSLDISAIKTEASTLFRSSPSGPWMKHLERLSNCRIRRSDTLMGYPRAFRLLQMIAAFGCPEHFVALKGAITHYRGLGLEEVVSTPIKLPSHLYMVGLWTEHLGLINNILQRLVRAHFTSLIEDGKDLMLNTSRQMGCQTGGASRATKAMVIEINPKMKGWDVSDDPAKRSAFSKVQRNLQRWRREGAVWSLIQRRFSSLAVLVLAPHQIRVSPTAQSISGSSFQNEIPHDAQALFVDALAELRPSLWTYVPKLTHLFDALFNPSKLHDCKFKIELATDHDIRSAAPDSDLLIDAFEYSQTPIVQPLAIVSQPSMSNPVSKKTIIGASRLGQFDDILTHFYIKKRQFWAHIQTNDPHFKPPTDTDILISNSLNVLAGLKLGHPAAKDAVNNILGRIGLKDETSKVEQRVFHKHLIGYFNIWSPNCPVKISMTNRYTVNNFEAAVGAKRNIRKGQYLHHLCGILGIGEPGCPSAVRSTMVLTTESKTPTEYLLLGPARFVNHDCKPNAEFIRSGEEVVVRASRDILRGEEITVSYGKDYFAPGSCLCGSCEIQSLGGWTGRGDINRPGDHARIDALRRRAPNTPLITESQSKELEKLPAPSSRYSEDYMLEDFPLFKDVRWYECDHCHRRSSVGSCLFCNNLSILR